MSDDNTTNSEPTGEIENEECEAWNHMGVVRIHCDEWIDVEPKSDEVYVSGDHIRVSLDVGSNGYDGEHEWVNHASINITEDRVMVSVSVDDPRGSIPMTIERDVDGVRTLIVPHENNLLQHVRMTPITLVSQGIFQLGESAWADEMDEKREQYRDKELGHYRALVEIHEMIGDFLDDGWESTKRAQLRKVRDKVSTALNGGDSGDE